MGIISIVYDLDSDTYMAVKKTNTLNQNYYEFLQQEVSAWLILNKHLNIANFFYYRKDSEGIPLLYSEFINGGNLRKWIIKSRIKDEKKKLLIILSIALQISYAMSNSHKQNVFHLDLRLENILDYKEKVNIKDPHIAIIDFGIHIKDKEELLKIIKSDCFLNYRKNPYYYRKWPKDNNNNNKINTNNNREYS